MPNEPSKHQNEYVYSDGHIDFSCRFATQSYYPTVTDYINWRQASNAMMAENFYLRNGNIFYPEISWDGPGPSYNGREFQTVTYIAALLYRVVGQQDWVGRSIAILFGIWGIFALYQLVRRVWSEQHALISAAVMAVIPGAIFFERSFLPDPAMVALVVTSFWLLVAYLQTDRIQYLVMASVIGAWGFLTKITGLIVGIPMIYTLLALWGLRQLRQPKRFIPIVIATVATLMPVIAYYLWARHLALSYPPYHFAGSGNWLWDQGLSAWLEKHYFVPGLLWVFNTWLWTKPVILLVALGLIIPPPQTKQGSFLESEKPSDTQQNDTQQNNDVPNNDAHRNAKWLFHWWAFAGVIYYVVGAKELVPNSWNFHILNPAAAALASHAILTIMGIAYRLAKRPAAIACFTVIFITILGFGHRGLKTVYQPSSSLGGIQSYQLGIALRQISQPDDLVITIANDIGSPIAIYYSQRRGWTFPPARNDLDWSDIPEDEDFAITLLEELRAKGADWFGIVNEHKDKLFVDRPRFADYIQANFTLQAKDKNWMIYRIPMNHQPSKPQQ